ncbi:GNAT family N-acetyltransferase [Nocardiopsis sp. EMB25]|uniref:GNAT family N-acetyltransferase n=1 Tax=Nocardiopsis sp. EMB25 TaxID=2835867 RepID=UPI002284B75E|nr:GNAT family protein [Nocardiopsis sp. EMB25]MCY9786883.1 GNAT family N-acetyltransferase [Nocardiopsis sp. EMB25]
MLSTYFPPMGLRLTTPRLELRLPGTEDLGRLAQTAAGGIHETDAMPFAEPWTDGTPTEVGLRAVQYNLARMAEVGPKKWSLNLVVVHEDTVLGIQDIGARDFAITRQVSTGSWLGRRHQGRGFGTEMRAAVLHLAFAELGAVAAETAVLEGNTASERVSRKLGYRPNGASLTAVRGQAVVEHGYRLTRQDWEKHRTVPVTVTGLEPCLPLLGLAAAE